MATTIKNIQFRKMMDAEGLGWIDLVKADGYFFIDYNSKATEEQKAIWNSLYDTSIYVYAFNHQSPETWVNDIKNLINK